MSPRKKTSQDILTFESIYEDLSFLVFSIVCIIMFGILVNGQPMNPPNLRVYIGFGFFSLSFILFIALIGKLTSYYAIKTYDWFRERWEKYKWYYWITILLITLGILFLIGYYKLSSDVFWSIVISVFAASILGSIGWILAYKIWSKKSKQD